MKIFLSINSSRKRKEIFMYEKKYLCM